MKTQTKKETQIKKETQTIKKNSKKKTQKKKLKKKQTKTETQTEKQNADSDGLLTQIKNENGSAKQNGSKQEKREGPELQDWVSQKPPCFAVVAEQTLALQMRNTAQSVEHNGPQTNQPNAKWD